MCKASAFSSCQQQSVLSIYENLCIEAYSSLLLNSLFTCAEKCTGKESYPDPDTYIFTDIQIMNLEALEQEKGTGRN